MLTTTLVNCVVFLLVVVLQGLYGMGSYGGFINGITGSAPLSVRALLLFVLAGALTTFGGRSLMYAAMPLIGPARAASIKSLSPIFTTVAAIMVLGEPYSLLQGAGTAVALAGLWILSGDLVVRQRGNAAQEAAVTVESHTPRRTAVRGLALAIGSAASFGVGFAVRKAALSLLPSPTLGALIGSSVALVVVVATSIWRPTPGYEIPRHLRASALAPFLLLGGIFTSLGQLSGFFSLQYANASLAAVLGSIDPLFTLLFGPLVLGMHELLTLRSVLGVLMTVVGAAMVIA